MLRVGVVGCGKIAEKHLAAYSRMPGVRVTVSDADVSRAEALAARFSVAFIASPEALVSGDEVDAIDVCVPTPYHPLHIMASLDSGKHVFCEKPLADTLDEALEILRRRDATGATVMVGYLYRFHPAFALAKQALDRGWLGDPYLAMLRLGGRGSHRAWKHMRASGGGAINEMFVHMLDLALWWFGEPTAVRVLRADTVRRERFIPDGERTIDADAEDFVLVELETRSGCRVYCQSDLVTSGYMNHVEVQGTNGSLFSSIMQELPTRIFCKDARGEFAPGESTRVFDRVDLFERELGHFVASAAAGVSPEENSLEDSIKMLEVIEEIRRQVSVIV